MLQGWHDLASVHWRYDPTVVQSLLPAGFRVDTFDDAAWVGLIPFHMRRIRLPGLPSFGPLSTFPETNIRTYIVDAAGRRGVWFASLDVTASSRPSWPKRRTGCPTRGPPCPSGAPATRSGTRRSDVRLGRMLRASCKCGSGSESPRRTSLRSTISSRRGGRSARRSSAGRSGPRSSMRPGHCTGRRCSSSPRRSPTPPGCRSPQARRTPCGPQACRSASDSHARLGPGQPETEASHRTAERAARDPASGCAGQSVETSQRNGADTEVGGRHPRHAEGGLAAAPVDGLHCVVSCGNASHLPRPRAAVLEPGDLERHPQARCSLDAAPATSRQARRVQLGGAHGRSPVWPAMDVHQQPPYDFCWCSDVPRRPTALHPETLATARRTASCVAQTRSRRVTTSCSEDWRAAAVRRGEGRPSETRNIFVALIDADSSLRPGSGDATAAGSALGPPIICATTVRTSTDRRLVESRHATDALLLKERIRYPGIINTKEG
jgi:hypothetical protein